MRAFVPLFCSVTISFSQSGLDIAKKLDEKEGHKVYLVEFPWC